MSPFRGVIPIAVSLSIIAAATAVLWYAKTTTTGSHHLVFLYLFPLALIAVLYTGRLAILCTAVAILCADYFLQDPLYSLTINEPLQYGDLISFAVLAALMIKSIRVLLRPRAKVLRQRGW
jgi:K+-sensing histidine kinase KdpD